MEFTPKEIVDRILSEEAFGIPSEPLNEEAVPERMHLPPWYDKKLYKSGQKFIAHNIHGFAVSVFLTIVSVLVVPSTLNVFVAMKKFTSTLGNYHRYKAAVFHVNTWYNGELKPGTKAWESLNFVRVRHIRASLTAQLQNKGQVSQRDLALSQWSFMGLCVLKPDLLGIQACDEDSWEGFLHFWRTICYILGLDDRYNICSKSITETREICQMLLDRVFTPCFENVPENFEHMAYSALDSMCSTNPIGNINATIYLTKYLCDVPGYVLFETERMRFHNSLVTLMEKNNNMRGIESAQLVQKLTIDNLPERSIRYYHPKDYKLTTKTPEYKTLSFLERFYLSLTIYKLKLSGVPFIRILLNILVAINVFMTLYFPVFEMLRFGKKYFITKSVKEGMPISNVEFRRRLKKRSWYKQLHFTWDDQIYL